MLIVLFTKPTKRRLSHPHHHSDYSEAIQYSGETQRAGKAMSGELVLKEEEEKQQQKLG